MRLTRRTLAFSVSGVLLAVVLDADAAAQTGIEGRPRVGMSTWDTVHPSAELLTSAAIAVKQDWKQVPRNEQRASFQGDAVISNGRVMAAVRKRSAAIDLYALGARGAVARAQLRLFGDKGQPAATLERVSLVDNRRSEARLTVVFQTRAGKSIAASFRLKRGAVALEIEPQRGTGSVDVACPGRFVLLPDFFADDIVIDASKIGATTIDIPSEHFLLHLTGEGDSIAMCVFENREQDVTVALAGDGPERVATGSKIDFGNGGKVWIALIDGPQVWHTLDVATEDAQRVKRLDWKMPFDAQWRIDFTRPNELIDSWEFLLRDKSGNGYLKPNWMARGARQIGADRKRWTTVLGRFQYPCWTDGEGQGYLQPLRHKALSFEGPAVIYPINRVEQTPTDTYTVVDVMRNCLGVGPCEYILNVEGQKQEYKGRATCSARDALLAIYRKHEQKTKTKEIESALDDALVFVTHIRGRISEYVEFGQQMRQYLAKQKAEHPDLSEFLDKMGEIIREIDVRIEARRDKIRTPKYVAAMNEAFRKTLLGYQGTDAEQRLKKYTGTLTEIGGNQDELVGECRWIVKSLRQRAGLLSAQDPRCTEIAGEIRRRCQKVLLKPSTYEGVRH